MTGEALSYHYAGPARYAPTLAELVDQGAAVLSRAGVSRPGHEARELVAAVLDKPRFWPVLHAGERPTHDEVAQIRTAVMKRGLGAPFAYAVGKAAFRFLTLRVDERVLIPRPETEQLVELVLGSATAKCGGGVVVDVGTGSGAIALALAAEGRFSRVVGTDVSSDALRVARENRRLSEASLRAPVELRPGSGLAPLRHEQVDIVVSNPPYIAYEEMSALPGLVRDWEPAQALCCSGDGLSVTREIIASARHALRRGGLLALEVDSRRAEVVGGIVHASGAFSEVVVRRDYSGRNRFVLATRTPSH
ncbi:MAG: peptide chain release factor N(5)-glutamine methyltransferase [Gemmatimonadaceae bacterium]